MTPVSRETNSAANLLEQLRVLRPGLPEPVLKALGAHFALMLEWNHTHNLTRVTDPAKAAAVHYLDSLLPLLDLPAPSRMADLGSGNGLPGVAAAALWPESQVVLVESVAKKCSFLRAVRAALGLRRLEVIAGKIEAIEPVRADLVLTRATFQWPELAARSARHLAPGGVLLAYIGRAAPSAQDWAEKARAAGLVAADLRSYALPPDAAVRHCALAQAPA
jgi:16S rRNA (guanine527-N7)-methyltransferase